VAPDELAVSKVRERTGAIDKLPNPLSPGPRNYELESLGRDLLGFFGPGVGAKTSNSERGRFQGTDQRTATLRVVKPIRGHGPESLPHMPLCPIRYPDQF
jgi:hypothetical protein